MLNVLQGATIMERNVALKIKIMEDINDDEFILSSSRVILEVNEMGKNFYRTIRIQ